MEQCNRSVIAVEVPVIMQCICSVYAVFTALSLLQYIAAEKTGSGVPVSNQ